MSSLKRNWTCSYIILSKWRFYLLPYN